MGPFHNPVDEIRLDPASEPRGQNRLLVSGKKEVDAKIEGRDRADVDLDAFLPRLALRDLLEEGLLLFDFLLLLDGSQSLLELGGALGHLFFIEHDEASCVSLSRFLRGCLCKR